MSKWLVEIVGDEFDLKSLPSNFIFPDLNIMEDSGLYYLSSTEFEDIDDPEIIHEISSQYITVLNGINILHNQTCDPVSVNSVIKLEDDGRKSVYIKPDIIKVRAKIRGVDVLRSSNGTVINSTPITSQWATVALKNEDIRRALSLFIMINLTWDILYKIFEIVKSGVGQRIYTFEGISRQEINRFTQTANSRQAIGDKSRHPGRNYQSPNNPMTFKEARVLIRTILSQWISQ